MAEKYVVAAGDESATLELRREDGQVFVRREGAEEWHVAELERVGDSGLYLLMLDNHPIELYLERKRGGAAVTIGRHIFDYSVAPWRPGLSQKAKAGSAQQGPVRITAPMTGSVVEVRCSPGMAVAAGEVLLVIESMKMNNELRSPVAGTVESVPVGPGQRIKAGELLVALQSQAG
jgi:biotin carboxyl carrier protein